MAFQLRMASKLVNEGRGAPKHSLGPLMRQIHARLTFHENLLQGETNNPAVNQQGLLKEIPRSQVLVICAGALMDHHFATRGATEEEYKMSYLYAELFTDPSMYKAARFEVPAVGEVNLRVALERLSEAPAIVARIPAQAPAAPGAGVLPWGLYRRETFAYDHRIIAANITPALTLNDWVDLVLGIVCASTPMQVIERERRYALALAHFVIAVCKKGTVTTAYIRNRFRLYGADVNYPDFDGDKRVIDIMWRCYLSQGMDFQAVHDANNVLDPATANASQRFFDRIMIGLEQANALRLRIIVTQARNAGMSVASIITDAINQFPDFVWNAIRTGVVDVVRPAAEAARLEGMWRANNLGIEPNDQDVHDFKYRASNANQLITVLNRQFIVYATEWRHVLANPFYSYGETFSGKSKQYTELGYLSKMLLQKVGGVGSMDGFAGLEKAADARIMMKPAIDHLITLYMDKQARMQDPISVDSENNTAGVMVQIADQVDFTPEAQVP